MLEKKRIALFVPLLILTLAVLACAGGGAVQPDPAQPEPAQPADDGGGDGDEDRTAFEGGGVIVGEESIQLKSTGLESLDSYSATFAVQFVGDDLSSLSLVGDIAAQRAPEARQLNMTFSGEGVSEMDGSGEFSSVLSDGTSYVVLNFDSEDVEARCVSFPADTDIPFDDTIITVDDYTDDLPPSLALLAEQEEVNGIPAGHYQATGVTEGDLNNATVDVWVSKAYNVVVKITIHDEGHTVGENTGTLDVTYEVTTINEPITVNEPQDCTSFGQ